MNFLTFTVVAFAVIICALLIVIIYLAPTTRGRLPRCVTKDNYTSNTAGVHIGDMTQPRQMELELEPTPERTESRAIEPDDVPDIIEHLSNALADKGIDVIDGGMFTPEEYAESRQLDLQEAMIERGMYMNFSDIDRMAHILVYIAHGEAEAMQPDWLENDDERETDRRYH